MERGEEHSSIRSFTDLVAWQEGHRLVLTIYKITKSFPKEETFGLISQMRRAVGSITHNIAEGFSRKSYKEKSHFYFNSLGSLTELQDQLLIARDVHYLTNDTFQQTAQQTIRVSKLINGLIKGCENRFKP